MSKKLIPVAGVLGFILMAGNVWGDTSLLMNLKSLLLVLGGTVMSTGLAFPAKTIRDLWQSLLWIRKNQDPDHDALIRRIASLAYVSRRYGLKALEKEGSRIENTFLRRGVELVVDGYDRFEIRNVLDKEYDLYFSRKESQANVLNTMAKLAPAFGFVGTLIGLIQVLGNLGTPADIGRGMALALLTTFYGILLANFFFLPLAKKFSEHTRNEATIFNVILEGVVDIADQKNSKAITHRLQSYMTVHQSSCTAPEEAPGQDAAEAGGKVRRFPVKALKERLNHVQAEHR